MAITITSQSGDPALCAIDCEGTASDPHRAIHFHSYEDYDSVLNGITITGGYTETGGAILLEWSSATITHCRFVKNSSVRGGVIYSWNSYYSSVEHCVFSENSGWRGGGVFAEVSIIPLTDCTFTDNEAANSGSALFGQNARITAHRCRFSGNGGPDSGGAVSLGPGTYDGPSTFTDCIFSSNRGRANGGAISAVMTSLDLENCVFDRNMAVPAGIRPGGGACALMDVAATITGCEFLDNEAGGDGGALFHDGGPCTLANCTLFGNASDQGGGISVWMGPMEVHNTIITQGRDGGEVYCSDPLSISCSDICDNEGGDWTGCIADELGINGNFSADPLFCSPEGELIPMLSGHSSPYSLKMNSPCLPGNHPSGDDCGLIGAHGQGCGIVTNEETAQPRQPVDETFVDQTTWGQIKAGYH